MNKKILSILLALMMLIGLMPNKIVAEESTVKTYEYADYTVEYVISNVWDNCQNILITIKNTGDTLIENWMLSYDFFC